MVLGGAGNAVGGDDTCCCDSLLTGGLGVAEQPLQLGERMSFVDGLVARARAAVAVVVPVLAMAKLGNPGIDAAGHQVNYWGNLVVPLALSLWPAAVLLLPES